MMESTDYHNKDKEVENMTLYEVCLDYLMLLNTMSEHRAMYHLDEQRRKLHNELEDSLKNEGDCDRSRLDLITGNLDVLIDFQPPLERHDSVKVYASNLERILYSAAGRMFLRKIIDKLNTPHGTIEA